MSSWTTNRMSHKQNFESKNPIFIIQKHRCINSDYPSLTPEYKVKMYLFA
jgi:hypothetical protein